MMVMMVMMLVRLNTLRPGEGAPETRRNPPACFSTRGFCGVNKYLKRDVHPETPQPLPLLLRLHANHTWGVDNGFAWVWRPYLVISQPLFWQSFSEFLFWGTLGELWSDHYINGFPSGPVLYILIWDISRICEECYSWELLKQVHGSTSQSGRREYFSVTVEFSIRYAGIKVCAGKQLLTKWRCLHSTHNK